MFSIPPIPVWEPDNWKNWQTPYDADNYCPYYWQNFIRFGDHPVASQLAKESRVTAKNIDMLHLELMADVWAKDILKRSIGGEKLQETARKILDDKKNLRSIQKDKKKARKAGLKVLRDQGFSSEVLSSNMFPESVKKVIAQLVEERGGVMGPTEDFIDEYLSIEEALYFLGRGKNSPETPCYSDIEENYYPFLVELSLLEGYYLPDRKIQRFIEEQMDEKDIEDIQEITDGCSDTNYLETLVCDAVTEDNDNISHYALRLLQQPHRYLVELLYDRHLWMAYGQSYLIFPTAEFDEILALKESGQLDFENGKTRYDFMEKYGKEILWLTI